MLPAVKSPDEAISTPPLPTFIPPGNEDNPTKVDTPLKYAVVPPIPPFTCKV